MKKTLIRIDYLAKKEKGWSEDKPKKTSASSLENQTIYSTLFQRRSLSNSARKTWSSEATVSSGLKLLQTMADPKVATRPAHPATERTSI